MVTRSGWRSGALVVLALSACDPARQAPGGGDAPPGPAPESAAASCTRCHGTGDDPAPPRASNGDLPTTSIRVGAHQAHLKDGALHRAFACSECHVVPTDTSHVDGVARIAFGPRANAEGVTSSWDRTSATCATYCHGATLAGGSLVKPVWTAGPSQAACGSCHGAPPPAPHPQGVADCGGCHEGYTATSVNLALHVDGKVQVASAGGAACGSCHAIPPPAPHPASTQCATCHPGYTATSVVAATHQNGVVDLSLSCTSCHGDAARPSSPAAPPKATNGDTATTARGVGAHQAHLGAALSAPVACGECHVVPTNPSHATGSVEVTFGALASAGGAAASWNGSSLTCATYCHGATLGGGAARSPVWTKVDGTQRACASCHGAPPPAPHAQSTDCGSCHTGYTSTSVNRATHVDGKVDVGNLSCTSCHGDAGRASSPAAPPVDASGNTATTARGVGAHQAHLGSKLLPAPVSCAECHVVPTSTSHADGAVGITFGTLAKTGGATPAWNAAALSCATTYCHGATVGGGTAKSPVWTKVDGTQKTCASCHGAPPPAPHAQSTDCGSCHGGYTSTTVNAAVHLNGRVDVAALSCTSCHGDPARASNPAAPPKDSKGNTATTARGVGAHQAHLVAGAISAATACTECHAVPTSSAHTNGAVELTFGARARTAGATPVWSGGSLTCATTYCHGATVGGGTAKSPVWTRVDGTQKTCGSCHGAPPPAPHTQSTACGSCHTGYGATTVNLATHLNGQVDVAALSCTSCHGDPARASNPTAPPKDSKGNTATTARGVGAHQAHLVAGTISAATACTECHVVPTSTSHSNGAVGITFGTRAGGATATWNATSLTCATYCHGATLGGGTAKSPVWTKVDGTQKTCGSCHGAPPPAPHTQSTSCGSCHTGYGATTVNLTTHLNGQVDVAAQSCTSCHGDPARASNPTAPPKDSKGNTATTARGVGAHQAHLVAGTISAATACTECHVVPTSTSHSNGAVGITFGTRAGGATATWNATSLTCATYCHGATLGGGTAKSPVWTKVDGTQKTCGSCHGAPPPAPHTQSTACGSCHTGYGATTVNLATHLNGQVDVAALSCTSCHGDPARASNPTAPPKDSKGNTATTARGVGAHQSHLGSTLRTGGVACTDCHVLPTSTGHANGIADVTFGGAAKLNGQSPTWNTTSLSCATTACHASTLTTGGTARTPVWTKVDGTQKTCGSCHGAPPSSGQHGRSQHRRSCGDCHGSGYTTSAVNATLHMNGARNVGNRITSWNATNRTCTNSCHGSESW